MLVLLEFLSIGICIYILEYVLCLLLHERVYESLWQLYAAIGWVVETANVLVLLEELFKFIELHFQKLDVAFILVP